MARVRIGVLCRVRIGLQLNLEFGFNDRIGVIFRLLLQ